MTNDELTHILTDVTVEILAAFLVRLEKLARDFTCADVDSRRRSRSRFFVAGDGCLRRASVVFTSGVHFNRLPSSRWLINCLVKNSKFVRNRRRYKMAVNRSRVNDVRRRRQRRRRRHKIFGRIWNFLRRRCRDVALLAS